MPHSKLIFLIDLNVGNSELPTCKIATMRCQDRKPSRVSALLLDGQKPSEELLVGETAVLNLRALKKETISLRVDGSKSTSKFN